MKNWYWWLVIAEHYFSENGDVLLAIRPIPQRLPSYVIDQTMQMCDAFVLAMECGLSQPRVFVSAAHEQRNSQHERRFPIRFHELLSQLVSQWTARCAHSPASACHDRCVCIPQPVLHCYGGEGGPFVLHQTLLTFWDMWDWRDFGFFYTALLWGAFWHRHVGTLHVVYELTKCISRTCRPSFIWSLTKLFLCSALFSVLCKVCAAVFYEIITQPTCH